MSTVLLPPGDNPIADNKYIIYSTLHYLFTLNIANSYGYRQKTA